MMRQIPKLKTPEAATMTLDEFSDDLRSRHWMSDFLYEIYMNAARKRYAWEAGKLNDCSPYSELIDMYGDAAGSNGHHAWINKRGQIVYTAWAAHDDTPLIFFGQTVGEFEKQWARVTRTTHTLEDAIAFVNRPTKAQKNAVMEVLVKRAPTPVCSKEKSGD